jgi:hypothetical protein
MGRRVGFTVVLAIALAISSTPRSASSGDKETAAAAKVLSQSDDFRLRVDAALRLGNSGDPKARKPLEGALDDAHPSVRQAAATGLSRLGDALAIPALDARVSKEANAPTKAALKKAIDELKAGGTSSATSPTGAPVWEKTKYVVKLNKVSNASGVRGDALAAVLETSARAKFAAIPGVYVLPAGTQGATELGTAVTKGVPVMGIDAAIVSLDSAAFAGDIKIQAKVSMTLSKLQVLKASIEGNASTIGSESSTKNPKSMAKLQDMAVDGAVTSAMIKAPNALKVAAEK